MSKGKAKLVTVFMFTMIVLLLADAVAIWPDALPWVLLVFAIPGAWKFVRVLYIWLTTPDNPIVIKLPVWKGWKRPAQAKTYQEYAAARNTER